jgi:hypothetical protein
LLRVSVSAFVGLPARARARRASRRRTSRAVEPTSRALVRSRLSARPRHPVSAPSIDADEWVGRHGEPLAVRAELTSSRKKPRKTVGEPVNLRACQRPRSSLAAANAGCSR